jgi:DNA-binding LytR/AlgR family response regulator
MFIVMVEDEPSIARRIKSMVVKLLGKKITKLIHFDELDDAYEFINENPIDLLLLDLNLHGQNGFELLKHAVSHSFHSIIISAYPEKAIDAFAYGVLDFVEKPVKIERLEKALSRLDDKQQENVSTKFLAIKQQNSVHLIELDDVAYIKGADSYSEIFLKNGKVHLHDKNLSNLENILPLTFSRLHRSYIIPLNFIDRIFSKSGMYKIELNDNQILPISRSKYKETKELLHG